MAILTKTPRSQTGVEWIGNEEMQKLWTTLLKSGYKRERGMRVKQERNNGIKRITSDIKFKSPMTVCQNLPTFLNYWSPTEL